MMKVGCRIVRVLTCAWAVTLVLTSQRQVTLLFAQSQVAQINLSPPDAVDNDSVTFKLSGTWPNNCVPQSSTVSVSPGVVRIDTTNPGAVCPQVLTPWMLAGTIGKLLPGRYDVVVRFSGPAASSSVEVGRQTLTVSDSSLLNEVSFPMVVNGAVAEKLHYQTIFTVMNTLSGDVNATLQVFNNTGTSSGAFCSPLAAPPSNATFTLGPTSQY